MTSGEAKIAHEERSRSILRADGPIYKVAVRETAIFAILIPIAVGMLAMMRNDGAFAPLEPVIMAVAEYWPRLADAVPVLNSRVPGYGTKYGFLCVASLLICLTWLVVRWVPFAIRQRRHLHPEFPPRYRMGLALGMGAFIVCSLVILFYFEDIARLETSPSYSRPQRGSLFAYMLVPGFVIPGITIILSGTVVVAVRAVSLHQKRQKPSS